MNETEEEPTVLPEAESSVKTYHTVGRNIGENHEFNFAGIRIIQRGKVFEVEIDGKSYFTTEGVDVEFRKDRRPVVRVNFITDYDNLSLESTEE